MAVDQLDRGDDLFAAAGQLLHRSRYFLDLAGNILDQSGNFLKGLTGSGYDLGADFYFLCSGCHGEYGFFGIPLDFCDQVGDLFGSFLGLLCQLADFFGYDRKTAPLLASPGSFDSSIEGQQIRLTSDAGNCIDNLSVFLLAFAEFTDDMSGVVDGFFDM